MAKTKMILTRNQKIAITNAGLSLEDFHLHKCLVKQEGKVFVWSAKPHGRELRSSFMNTNSFVSFESACRDLVLCLNTYLKTRTNFVEISDKLSEQLLYKDVVEISGSLTMTGSGKIKASCTQAY
jgi:hypothetical protein